MPARHQKSNNKDNVCFEEALGKLELIVKELEKGEIPLEQALDRFAEGVRFSQICLSKLQAAEERIDTILREERGNISEYPLDLREEI